MVAFFVNRGWPAVGYEIRRKSSSGGQRIRLDSVALQRRLIVNLRNYGFPVRVMLLKVCLSATVMACMAIRAALACPIQEFASPTVITRLGS